MKHLLKKGNIPWNKGLKTGLVPLTAFRKGMIPWNKGIKLSKEHIINMSLAKKGKKLSEEHKAKLSMAVKGQISPNKGKKNSEEYKRKMSQIKMGQTHTLVTIEKMRRSALGRRKEILLSLQKQFTFKQPTSIEKTLYDYLLLKGILFEKQHLVNDRFIVDAYIPSLNLVIEADGKYWHTLDRVIKKDKAENAYLTKCGFNLLRLSEEEIKSGKFKERMVL